MLEIACGYVFVRRLTTLAFNIASSVRVKSSRSQSPPAAATSAAVVGAACAVTVSAAAAGVVVLAACNRLAADDGVAIKLLTAITTPPTATSMGVTSDFMAELVTLATAAVC